MSSNYVNNPSLFEGKSEMEIIELKVTHILEIKKLHASIVSLEEAYDRVKKEIE
jgi:hypothetical protein